MRACAGNDRQTVVNEFFATKNAVRCLGRYSVKANGETTPLAVWGTAG